jgi:hypothetical protein
VAHSRVEVEDALDGGVAAVVEGVAAVIEGVAGRVGGEVEAEAAVVEGVDVVTRGEAGVAGEGDVAAGVAGEGVDSRVGRVGVDKFAYHHPGVARLNNGSFGSAPRRLLDAKLAAEAPKVVEFIKLDIKGAAGNVVKVEEETAHVGDEAAASIVEEKFVRVAK